jgi:hypothetical protein
MKRRAFLAGMWGALTVLALPEAEAAAQDLQGRYKFSGGAKERKAIGAAIEGVVDEMSFIVRSIARKRLKAAAKVHPNIAVTAGEERITVRLGDRSYTAPANGKPVTVEGDDGDELQLRYVVKGDTIVQRFESDGGGKVNTFRPIGRNKMRVTVRIFSDRLPKDVKYKLTYRSKG